MLLGGGEATQAALNLGGIANVTVVPGGEAGEPAFAFDVGPANALVDAAVGYLTGGSETYDYDGRRAARGGIHDGLLRSLLAEPYYRLGPPKSTGKELFNLPYLLERLEPLGDIEADDLVATVTALTSRTVADALERYEVPEVVASGGDLQPNADGHAAGVCPTGAAAWQPRRSVHLLRTLQILDPHQRGKRPPPSLYDETLPTIANACH